MDRASVGTFPPALLVGSYTDPRRTLFGTTATLVRQSRLSRHDLRLRVGVHETTFRVNVRWVTPLGEETASTV
jgi:hypothetical protein